VNPACERVRELAPELALGVLAGAERAAAVVHLADCPECRDEVARLADAADALLLIAPEREPPSGFETRVLDAMARTRARPRRLRRVLAAAAVVVALVGGVAVGRATSGESGEHLEAASLQDGGGRPIGEVFLYGGEPTWLFVRFEGVPHGDAYELEVDVAGRGTVRRPAPWLEGGAGSWGATFDVDAGAVRAVRLVADDGWRCEAVF
jgi:hypothetical protein